MRTKIALSVFVATALCFCAMAGAAEEAKLKCPVSGKEASKDHGAAYKEGQVYFCCPNCPAAFAKNQKKFATKANAQLVQSGQYKQKKCPLSGEDVNPKASLKVAGVAVEFCCNNCKGKVAKAKKNEKLELVFSDEAFKKAFEKASEKASK